MAMEDRARGIQRSLQIENPPPGSGARRLRAAVFNDTRRSRHLGCHLVMNRLIHGLRAWGIDVVWLNEVGVDWRPAANTIPRHPDIDIAIVNGEGSIHHPDTRPRARYLCEVSKFAKETLGVPSVLLNATLSDLDGAAIEHIQLFNAVYVRERGSQSYLRKFHAASTVVPDLTFRDVPWSISDRKGFAVTDSVFPQVSAGLQSLASLKGWDYRSMIAPKPAVSSRWRMAPGTIKEFEKWIADHQMVVTGRFHTVTMCLASRTPFVAVDSNSPKVRSFVSDILGNDRRVLKFEELNATDFNMFSDFSEKEINAIDVGLDAAAKSMDCMFQSCRRIASYGKV